MLNQKKTSTNVCMQDGKITIILLSNVNLEFTQIYVLRNVRESSMSFHSWLQVSLLCWMHHLIYLSFNKKAYQVLETVSELGMTSSDLT